MALEKGLAEGGTSSSTASSNEVLQAESPHNSENQMCPICLDIINNQVSVSWCRHVFCFSLFPMPVPLLIILHFNTMIS
uniref:Zinc finger C3HC4 RING-type domain-containing protein n=1 Tax=Cyanoderma ruficeps TaxID=181631 RepID=A0A8C3X7R1_9PASS